MTFTALRAFASTAASIGGHRFSLKGDLICQLEQAYGSFYIEFGSDPKRHPATFW